MSNVITEIESKVNELYSKTKVTQKFTNPNEEPLELKIYIFKKEGVIFSSFNCKIGDSINVKSKVIKKEKAEKKYTDSIASGNAAIFVSDDPENENRIIINMGNIPPKTDVIFISEFIHSIEVSQKYEFEFFRNLPIFKGKYDIYENSELKGKINIHTKSEILNIEKNILMKNLKIIEEKFENNKKNSYLINYQIEKLPQFSWYDSDYIPSSKIYFDLNMNEPFAYLQKSLLNNNENNYFIQYRYKNENLNNENETTNPALFIFLVDQSGSMEGSRIKIASKALQLFIQSLPVGSYYQIIGFGSNFRKYDNIPKEYKKQNIEETMKILEKLDADLGGTELEGPLKDIYNSSEIYDKINLPRNIFLLTDGEVWDKKIVLELIEKNSNKYTIYSIGIGESFDEDLIKNAGIIGKGNYNFCKNLDNLNSIIVSEINKATSTYISDLKINTNLNDINIIKNNLIPNILRDNSIINLYYILDNKNKIDKIKINITYKDNDNKKFEKKYEIIPIEIENGEDLSKLIINNYILNNKDISEDEKLKIALKYQIFTNNTSLYAEIELSEKISEEMKLKIIGDKENNFIKEIRKERNYECYENECCDDSDEDCDDCDVGCCDYDGDEKCCDDDSDEDSDRGFDYENRGYRNICCESGIFKEEIIKDEEKCLKKEEENNKNIDVKKDKIELNNKEDIMKMINTQDFIDGCWEENEYTKMIKDK